MVIGKLLLFVPLQIVVQDNKGGAICTTYCGGTIKHGGTDNNTIMNKDKHIPSGYKPSPLGPIPEDWEVKKLGEVAEMTSGTTPSRANIDFYSNGSIPWVKTTDLNNGILNSTEESVTNKALEKTSLKLLPKGTVLVAMYGGFNQIGRTAMLGMEATINQALSALICNEKIYNAYLLSWLNCRVKEWKHLAASSRKDPNITGKDVARFPIAVPPLPEQQRIVSVLSLWDAAIAKQTALIEQLTLRKRGLMQQLLTGKKRLKGSEGGNFHRLGNYISECNRRNAGCNRVLSVTNTKGFILQEEQFDKIVASNDTSNYKVVRRGEFAYNPSRVNVGSLAMLNEYDEGILSPMYIVFKANENIDKNYLLQCLQSYWFRGHIPAYTQGSVRDSLSFDGLCSMKFYIPTLQEQKAISSILERADKEIEIQKQKLAAMQEQKKGLMQVLLTGKRRIKIN